VGERGLALGQRVVSQNLADGRFGLAPGRLIGALANGRLVFGLAAGRLVVVLPAG
jgi:hypothetical protein